MSASYDIVCLVSNDITYDRRMIRICSALAETGKSVLLIGRQLPSSEPLGKWPFDTDRVVCKYYHGPMFYAELIWRFKKYLQKVDFSNLVVTDLDTIAVARSYKSSKVKVFCDLHEYFEETPELIGKPIKKWMWSKLSRLSISSIDVIYTVNQSLADIFSINYNREVSVIRNLPDPLKLQGQPASLPLKTVYLGVLNPGRGLEAIIQAIKQREDVMLTIIGDGPLKKDLERLARDSTRISFKGALLPDQLSDELTQHHLGWNVLDDTSKSYYYSLANKFYDYLNHGLPTLTMDFPEYRNVIEAYDCGMLLKDASVAVINDTLSLITADLGQVKRWQSNCPLVITDHNWSLESKKLLSLF